MEDMEVVREESDNGRLFIRRVQEVLKTDENITIEGLASKVEEMKDLMTTLAKMLKHASQKVKTLEEEKDLLAKENKTVLELMVKMENHLAKAEDNLAKFTEKCKEFEDLRDRYETLRKDMEEVRKQEDCSAAKGDVQETQNNTKTKKTQTNQNYSQDSVAKYERGDPFLEDHNGNSSLLSSDIDVSLQKLQTFLLYNEKKWHLTSGREREQRVKINRLLKQMKTLQNQLDWKTNQLNFKETEIKERNIQLSEAEKKISELKRAIKISKTSLDGMQRSSTAPSNYFNKHIAASAPSV